MSSDAGTPAWGEIEQVLGLVLDLPEDRREAYLALQPAQLRAEVESLLAAHRRAGSFLGKDAGKVLGMQAGTQLGPYRIETVIGEGGMGVVYRALDTKLNRPVAVKFLFDSVADAAARRRFQREAQMASSLNHPHILTVYDAGDFEGCQYLVTELVDGGTLRDWARGQKRSWREIVTLLSGVADGLAAAHTAGILHRDIKPDNILVGLNGYAKLADFGLAKVEERSSPEAVTRTLQAETTRPGMILGTIAYMSPEQASGRPTDARSDIFSFGVVLYELLAGRRPFQGATDLEVLQTIIHGSAPPLSGDVPLALQMLVAKALEHSAEDRYQSTRDLVVDLRRLTRQSAEPPASINLTAASVGVASPRWKAGAVSSLVLLALVVVSSLFWWRLQQPAAQAPLHVVQFDIAPPAGTIFAPSTTRQPFAISPDGKRLAFTATGANGTNIWIRDLASLDMRPVPGTEGVWSVFWSPDSRSVYYSVKWTLKEANLETGSGRSVAEFTHIAELGTWRSNGDLLLYLGAGGVVDFHPQDGSTRKVATGIRWPQFLPGGDRLVYAAYDGQAKVSHAMALDYIGGEPLTLMETNSRVQYAPPLRDGEPGALLFIRGGSLLAQPFDAIRLRLMGDPVSIAQNVSYYGPVLSADFSVSANGVLVYQAGFPNAELKWYDRTGNEVGTAGQPSAQWGQVRLSHDGKRLAATLWNAENGGTGIWIFDANGRETRRLTFPPDVDRRAIWSPDGTKLAVGRSPTVGSPQLSILDVASGRGYQFALAGGLLQRGAGEAASAQSQPFALPTDWSRDGRYVVFDDGLGAEAREVWLADTVERKFVPLFQNKFPQWGTAFSPDGKRIAFVSIESGRPEIYVQAFESRPSPHAAGEKRQVSRDGAWLVRWRADGSELFFVGMDNSLQAVSSRGAVEFSEPKILFRIPGASQYGTTRDFQFDVSPDGQRFIMPTTGSVAPSPLTVIENWQEKFHR
jgi:eukaryotic-like serine/threonine-protein kinase